jgi:GNAT superfamily N-acetyltransferase
MNKKIVQSTAIRLSIDRDAQEVAHAYVFLITNDLHKEPYGLLEDVFVDEAYRGQGIGTELVTEIIATAKQHGCYKLIATSRHARPEVHAWYEKIGFEAYGVAFRMDLPV